MKNTAIIILILLLTMNIFLYFCISDLERVFGIRIERVENTLSEIYDILETK